MVLKILEHLQIIYFLMRGIEGFHWDFSFFVFFSAFLNFISLDQLFRSRPELFIPIFYTTFMGLVGVLIASIVIALTCGWGKKPNFIVRIFIILVSSFFYLVKTVLIIPLLNIALVSIIPFVAR